MITIKETNNLNDLLKIISSLDYVIEKTDLKEVKENAVKKFLKVLDTADMYRLQGYLKAIEEIFDTLEYAKKSYQIAGLHYKRT